MTEVHQRPPEGKGSDPPSDRACPHPFVDAESDVKPLALSDPAAVRVWLADLRSQIEDVAAAGEDATRSPGRRMLGRAMARGAILEARRALRRLVAAAERALEPG